jgi:hypothetical protein
MYLKNLSIKGEVCNTDLRYLGLPLYKNLVFPANLRFHWTDFRESLYLSVFGKSRKFKFHQNLTTITVLYMNTYVHLW